MGKRILEDIPGRELGQQRPKRKVEEHKTLVEVSNNKLEGAFEMDSRSEHLQEKSVTNDTVLLLLIGKEGDVGTNAGVGSAGTINEASGVGSFSSEYSISEEVLCKEDNSLVNKAASCSEHPNVISPAEKDVVLEESIFSVESDEHYNNMTNTSSKQHQTSLNRGKNGMPEFTGYGSRRKICHKASLNENFTPESEKDSSTLLKVSGGHPDKNIMLPEVVSSSKPESSVEDINCGISARENNMRSGTASESYMTKVSAVQANVEENDMYGTEVVREHVVDVLPLVTECGNEENSKKAFLNAVCLTDANNMNHFMHDENVSTCRCSRQHGPSVVEFHREPLSSISTAVNQRVIHANCKGESSLPPSPIRGLIDSCAGRPKWHNNQLSSLDEEAIAFSFQLLDKFNNVSPKNKIGSEMQGALGRVTEPDDHSQTLSMECPCDIVSISRDRDIVIEKDKERTAPVSCSCTLEVNSLSVEMKTNVGVLSSMPPERSLASRTRKKLLVLDLNGLLADIVNDYNVAYRVQKRIGGKPIFKRPFCDDFLKFCFEKFDIGIWSSRRKYNVDSAVDYLMGEFKHKLLFCWDQSKCTCTGVQTLDNHHKPLVLKELMKLWNKEESDLPWEKGDFSPSNTLLLDDSPYKALFNPPYTAIFPLPYHYNDIGDNSLGPGGDIRVYLEQLVLIDDVQHYVKDHPFGQPAITTSNQDWNFYFQIIESHATPLS